MIEQHQFALYLDKSVQGDGSDYFRIQKSTSLVINTNPESETYKYIADPNSTNELISYNPSIDQDLTMHQDEEDYKFIFDKFFNQATGEKAKVKCLLVFMAEKVQEEEETYKAWETDATLVMSDINTGDRKINFNIFFGGTTRKGKAKFALGKPTFNEDK